MDIKQYIKESEKEYHLRIKTICPITDKEMDKIEHVITKFDPLDITRPKKTILQKNPLDFPFIDSAEVWIIDVTFRLPASPFVLRETLRKALDIPEKWVVVRTYSDPLEDEEARENAIKDIDDEAKRRGLVPAPLLSTDSKYPEANDVDSKTLFGDEYNNSLLNYLNTIEKEKKEKQKSKDSPFNWLDINKDLPEENGDYNKDLPIETNKHKPHPISSVKLPDRKILGDIDDKNTTIKKVFLDKNGNKVVISRDLEKE